MGPLRERPAAVPQPSFKLAEKERDGARVRKRYHRPATPCQRLLADPRTSQGVRDRVTALYAALDPVRLLSDMRTAQQQLVDIADRSSVSTSVSTDALPIEEFLAGLRIAWKEGEVRPTALPKPKQKRGRRRPDPPATGPAGEGHGAAARLVHCRALANRP